MVCLYLPQWFPKGASIAPWGVWATQGAMSAKKAAEGVLKKIDSKFKPALYKMSKGLL